MPATPSPLTRPGTQAALLMALLWAMALAALWAVREVLLPFAVAALLAYVLHPAVTWLSSRRIRRFALPRWGATLVLYALILAVVWGLGAIFFPQLKRELSGLAATSRSVLVSADGYLADGAEDLNELLRTWEVPVEVTWSDEDGSAQEQTGPLDGNRPSSTVNLRWELKKLLQEMEDVAVGLAGAVARGAQGVVGATVGFIFRIFLVLMLTAFVLNDVARIRGALRMLVPAGRRVGFDALVDKLDVGLSGVVRGQLTICGINSVLTLLGLVLLNVKVAFLLALIAGVLSVIPIFGSILSSIPIVVVALADSFEKAVLGLVWIIGIHALEANFLNPKIMGDAAKIHPVLVVLVLVVGEHFWGFTGALFAVPLLSMLLTMFKALHARALRLEAEAAASAQAMTDMATGVAIAPATPAQISDPKGP